MLVFVTTDCAISSEMLNKALKTDVETSFNMVSVDGDTSTNDMVTVLANGVGVVFFVALEENKLGHVVVPHVFVLAVFLGQGHGIEDVADTGVV